MHLLESVEDQVEPELELALARCPHRTYPLSETAAAIRYVGGGHAKAKAVVTI